MNEDRRRACRPTHALASEFPVLGHLVGGTRHNCRRNGHADRQRGLEIDPERHAVHQFDRNVGGLGTLEDLGDLASCPAEGDVLGSPLVDTKPPALIQATPG